MHSSKEMNNLHWINISQLGVNDVGAVITDWLVNEGSAVKEGDVICELETTKAAFELHAERSGYIYLLFDKDAEVEINSPLAFISKNPLNRSEADNYKKQALKKSEPQKATAKASRLAKQNDIDINDIKADGLIRERHIQEYIDKTKKQRDFPSEKTVANIAIYGAGKGGLTLYEAVMSSGTWKVVAFLDDDPKAKSPVETIPLFPGSILDTKSKFDFQGVAAAVANGSFKIQLLDRMHKKTLVPVNVINANSFISPSARIGRMNYIKSGAIIETGTVIEDACIIDNGVIIAHDSHIGNACHLAPGCSLGSSIKVGDGTIVGIGASISTGVTIGKQCIISIGTSVTHDIPDFSIVEGVPGRIMGKRKSGKLK